MGSSADFVISGPEQGLAFLLSEAGYDVWLGNFRGNAYSQSKSEDKRWDFTWHEMGVIDLAEMIEHVLEHTGQDKLHFVGHSLGTTAFLVLTSTRPEFNSKVICAHLMSPMAFMTHVRSPMMQVASRLSKERLSQLIGGGTGEFSPSNELTSPVQETCIKGTGAANLNNQWCSNTRSLMCGFDSSGINATLVSEILRHKFNGASARQIMQFRQAMDSGKFGQYDHGPFQNLNRYGTAKPPSYNLNEISVPISLYYSNNDWWAALDDVDRLKGKLLNVQMSTFLVPNPKWGHIDFLWGNDARSVVYDKIVNNMPSN